MSRRLLFSIPSYAYLEPSFLALGDFEQGKTERKYFPGGERYLRILSDLWGRGYASWAAPPPISIGSRGSISRPLLTTGLASPVRF